MRRALFLALPLLAIAAPARADDPRFLRHVAVDFAMLVGGYEVGPIEGPAIGMHFDVGRKFGKLRLMAEYDVVSIGENSSDPDIVDPVRGMMHRYGAGARYSFARFGGRKVPIQGDFWAEVGVGRQQINWYEGGILERDDVAMGFGAQMNVLIGQYEKARIFNLYYAFRLTIADRPEDKDPIYGCAGPCDRPTGPYRWDVGIYFHGGMGWQF